MQTFVAALIFVGFAIFLLCFNLIFRKKDFPDGEISHNKELRKQGIVCAKEEELRTWRKKRNRSYSCDEDICASCREICSSKIINK